MDPMGIYIYPQTKNTLDTLRPLAPPPFSHPSVTLKSLPRGIGEHQQRGRNQAFFCWEVTPQKTNEFVPQEKGQHFNRKGSSEPTIIFSGDIRWFFKGVLGNELKLFDAWICLFLNDAWLKSSNNKSFPPNSGFFSWVIWYNPEPKKSPENTQIQDSFWELGKIHLHSPHITIKIWQLSRQLQLCTGLMLCQGRSTPYIGEF